MKGILAIFNATLFTLLLVLPLIEARWDWPRYLKKLAAGVPSARMHHFRNLLLWEWVITLAFLWSWTLSGRPWASLLLHHVSPIQSALFLLYTGLMVLVFWRQRRTIFVRPATVERLRKQFDYAEPLLPHTLAERRMFWVVSATAGICEETLYRGFLIWYIAELIGNWIGGGASLLSVSWAAIVLSSLIFGVGHVYLGVKQVPKTALVGMVLGALAWFSGSLWPSIVLHAAIDWNSGELGFAILNTPGPATQESKSAAEST
jgi:membrane protease YdiL (CAAX protease family)